MTAHSDTEKNLFNNVAVATVIFDGDSARIRRVNDAAHQILAGTRQNLEGIPLAQLIADAQRITNASRELSPQQSVVHIPRVLVGALDGNSIQMDASVFAVHQDGGNDRLLLLMPVRDPSTGEGDDDHGRALRAEELSNTLTRQLSWERWVRQIVCKLHATLDRDTLLQTVVDGFGRALGASRCLIVRTDGSAAPMVTHEYVEPDISPLGLGRTGQFPAGAVSFFKHRVGAIADLSALEKQGELSPSEFEYFSDNGVRSMAGAPISSHGIVYGVIIILESGAGRKWASHELDVLEIAATQTAVALSHSQGLSAIERSALQHESAR